jgi:hypothetical protein
MSNTPPKTPLTPASSEDALMPGTPPPSDNYKTARQQRRGQSTSRSDQGTSDYPSEARHLFVSQGSSTTG